MENQSLKIRDNAVYLGERQLAIIVRHGKMWRVALPGGMLTNPTDLPGAKDAALSWAYQLLRGEAA